MKILVTYQDDPNAKMVEVDLPAVPRVGEKVGVRPLPNGNGRQFYLDRVVDVRYYAGRPGIPPDVRLTAVDPEIHVLTSSRS